MRALAVVAAAGVLALLLDAPAARGGKGRHGSAIGGAPSGSAGGGGGAAATPHSIEGMDCSACHTTDGWGLSARAGEQGFDHARTGFPLAGAHRDAGCGDCHAEGLRVSRACSSCHDDEHDGRLGADCASCHSPTAWQDTRTAERHRRTRLPLTGRHAVIPCADCHRRTTERAWSTPPADCFACHEDDYRNDAHPDHQGTATEPPFSRECGGCHRPSGWSPAVIVPRLAPRRAPSHDRFPLVGRHRAECETCHLDAARSQVVTCDGCHAHGAVQVKFAHPRIAVGSGASGCLVCHPRGTAR
jgi:hypothetical protein